MACDDDDEETVWRKRASSSVSAARARSFSMYSHTPTALVGLLAHSTGISHNDSSKQTYSLWQSESLDDDEDDTASTAAAESEADATNSDHDHHQQQQQQQDRCCDSMSNDSQHHGSDTFGQASSIAASQGAGRARPDNNSSSSSSSSSKRQGQKEGTQGAEKASSSASFPPNTPASKCTSSQPHDSPSAASQAHTPSSLLREAAMRSEALVVELPLFQLQQMADALAMCPACHIRQVLQEWRMSVNKEELQRAIYADRHTRRAVAVGALHACARVSGCDCVWV